MLNGERAAFKENLNEMKGKKLTSDELKRKERINEVFRFSFIAKNTASA